MNKKAFICLGIDNIGNNFCNVGLVRYLSTKYEIIYLAVSEKYYLSVKEFYPDLKNKIIYIVFNDSKIIKDEYSKNKMENYISNSDLYIDFIYKKKIIKKKDRIIPFITYTYLNLNPSIFWEYFYVPDTDESNKLFELIDNIKYAFIHSTYSQGQVFKINEIEKYLNISKDNTLIIDPNINHYNKKHKYYELANKFIYKNTILTYKKTIINADKLFLTDSSFFCLASQLNLKCKEPLLIFRYNNDLHYKRNIDWLNHKYLKKGLIRPKFKVIRK